MAALQERAHERYNYSGKPSTEVNDNSSDDDEPETPSHPIPSMQAPFTESIEDAALPETTTRPDRLRNLSAKARRARLLDATKPIHTYNAIWRSTPTAQYHPLTKILAQIAFGVHLLHQQLAKSDEEVVKILQSHVDEVDHFVATTEEDLDLALADIKERISYLKLPLEHVDIFDAMLDDKQFRTSIIEGNERIEQVVSRTRMLMSDLTIDIKKAMESTSEMSHYLEKIAGNWPEDDAGSIEIYHTMQANAEGWMQCLGTLQMKGNSLGVAIAQLSSVLTEMAKCAGAASRRILAGGRSKPQSRQSSRAPSHANSPRISTTARRTQRDDRIRNAAPLSRYSKREMKALPKDPDMVVRAVEATLPSQDKSRSRSQKQEGTARSRKQEEKTSLRHEQKPRSPRKEERTPARWYEEKVPARQYEEPRKTNPAPIASTSVSRSSSPKPKQKTRTKKAPPAPIKTSEKFGYFMRNASASASPSKPVSPRLPKDSDLKSMSSSDVKLTNGNAESKPQSTLKRARSKLLKRKSAVSLADTSKLEQQQYQNQAPPVELSGIPKGGIDSAYSSGTDAERRPNTSPEPAAPLRPPANFALFPSTPPSLAPSIHSPRSVSSNQDTDKESVIMALPPMPHKSAMEPSPLRQDSAPGPALKKKSSLASLLAFFKRHKSEKSVKSPPATLGVTPPVYELA